MDNTVKITQPAKGDGSTQIGVQKNTYFVGMTSEQVSKEMITIFLDNFPKLQALAAETAKQRAEELVSETLEKLSQKQITDFSPFGDPDVQYVVWEAQRDYARMGTKDKLEMLSALITTRIEQDNNLYLKTVIDQAISVAGNLSVQQLDYLSCIFMFKQVHFGRITDIATLSQLFSEVDSLFHPCGPSSISLLNSLGCLELNLGTVVEKFAKEYNLKKDEVAAVCPQHFADMNGDYACSHVGMVLAMLNIENKNYSRYDMEKWIHT